MMEAVGEAQVFAEKTGLGTGPMEELIGEAFGPVAGGYSKRYVLHLQTLQKPTGSDVAQINNGCLRTSPGLAPWIRCIVGHQGCPACDGYGTGPWSPTPGT